MANNDKKKTIHRSLTFGDKVYSSLADYSEKYFQGNISAAVCFIIIKYFEIEETGVIPASSQSKKSNPIKPVSNTKHTINLDILDNKDKGAMLNGSFNN